MHKHGARSELCPRSHKPPLDAAYLPQGKTAVAAAVTLADSASVSDTIHATAQPSLWSPHKCMFTKRFIHHVNGTNQKPQESLKGDITQHHVDFQAM